MSLGLIFKEIFETLSDRSFVALFIAAMLGAVATGLSAALAFYFSTYFWGFTSQQIGFVTLARRANYYGPGRDALVMALPLGEQA